MVDSNHTDSSGYIKVLYVDDDEAFIETSKLMLLDLNPTLVLIQHYADVKSAEHLFDLSRIYEQIGIERPGEIDVERCFNEAVALSPKLQINIVNQTSGLKVTADSLLKQVFYNFIDNSIRHGQKVTEIKLSYRVLGDEVVLTYQDNGIGIFAENKRKLFTEGFSTGNGTDLGLAIIR